MPMNHTYTYKEKFKNNQNGTHASETQQESMTTNPRDSIGQINIRVNSGQKDSINSRPLSRNIEDPSQESDAHTRTRYGRIIQKPDRLTY